MDDRTKWDPKIIEALEACRPDEQDLGDLATEALAADARLREHFAQIQQFDARLADAIKDVHVPEGLEDHILKQLSEESIVPRADESVPQPRRKTRSRRWVVGSAAAGAIAAAVLLLIALTGESYQDISPGAIRNAAIERFLAEADGPLEGMLVHQTPPPGRFPFSRDIVPNPSMRWRHVAGLLGQDAVAYDLTLPSGARATLYVVAGISEGLDRVPPTRPLSGTQNILVGAWGSEGLLYMLVVRGEERAYGRLLNLPRGPLA